MWADHEGGAIVGWYSTTNCTEQLHELIVTVDSAMCRSILLVFRKVGGTGCVPCHHISAKLSCFGQRSAVRRVELSYVTADGKWCWPTAGYRWWLDLERRLFSGIEDTAMAIIIPWGGGGGGFHGHTSSRFPEPKHLGRVCSRVTHSSTRRLKYGRGHDHRAPHTSSCSSRGW